MKTPNLKLAVCCVSLGFTAFAANGFAAAELEGEIQTIDARTSTITVKKEERVKTFRFRASVQVQVNGVKSKVEALEPGMLLVVESSEPGFAGSLEAFGVSTVVKLNDADVAKLKEALFKGPWLWNDQADTPMRFRGDGSVKHRGMSATYKIISPRDVLIEVDGGDRFVLRFDSTFTRYTSPGRKFKGKLSRE